jgi:riboflavin kinase
MIRVTTQNNNHSRVFVEAKKENFFETSKYLNLPDLQFFNWCNRQYQVNRGVYNTIDQWFYEYGIVNIHFRRIQILAFLDFVRDDMLEKQPKFIRFGHGGLSKRLNEFMNDFGQSNNVIPLKKPSK